MNRAAQGNVTREQHSQMLNELHNLALSVTSAIFMRIMESDLAMKSELTPLSPTVPESGVDGTPWSHPEGQFSIASNPASMENTSSMLSMLHSESPVGIDAGQLMLASWCTENWLTCPEKAESVLLLFIWFIHSIENAWPSRFPREKIETLYPFRVVHTTDTACRAAICMPHINLALLCTSHTKFAFTRGLFIKLYAWVRKDVKEFSRKNTGYPWYREMIVRQVCSLFINSFHAWNRPARNWWARWACGGSADTTDLVA